MGGKRLSGLSARQHPVSSIRPRKVHNLTHRGSDFDGERLLKGILRLWNGACRARHGKRSAVEDPAQRRNLSQYVLHGQGVQPAPLPEAGTITELFPQLCQCRPKLSRDHVIAPFPRIGTRIVPPAGLRMPQQIFHGADREIRPIAEFIEQGIAQFILECGLQQFRKPDMIHAGSGAFAGFGKIPFLQQLHQFPFLFIQLGICQAFKHQRKCFSRLF